VHTELWGAVCERGVLLSEWPPGTPPEPFRFPMRNRILAALSEVLVVVESRERGGSLITAQAALERSIDVLAVPGSPRNRAAAGVNHLLRDGASPEDEPDWRRKRDDAVLEVLYGSGLRVSELCGLEVGSLDLARSAVTVWGKGAKERRVPLSAPAVAALRAWLRVRGDVVVDLPDA
jgi:hypothetical protein